jgi:hypothetical protein
VPDVPVGGGVVLVDWDVVVTQPAPGTFKAFSADTFLVRSGGASLSGPRSVVRGVDGEGHRTTSTDRSVHTTAGIDGCV